MNTTSVMSSPEAGRLVIVGTGILAVSHMTSEAIGELRDADVVFFHATNGVTAKQISELNANVVDLYQYYGEDKIRRVTYIQMAELMLREVRMGRRVAGAFHGHPGFFVLAARRALAIAKMEGHQTHLLAAVSSIDCLLSDLRIDPGVYGLQIVKAGSVLRRKVSLATESHVALLQVGSVGDSRFSFSGFKHAQISTLFERLIEIYGDQQECTYYMAALFPILKPIIFNHKLQDFRMPEVLARVSSGILYLPPKGMDLETVILRQAFRCASPYGEFEINAIAELDDHATPPGYKNRLASTSFFLAMSELSTNPKAARLFHISPDIFLDSYPELLSEERQALQSQQKHDLRSVTTRKT